MMLTSITATYPGFQTLPKGIKQMLLASESLYFDDTRFISKTRTASQALVQIAVAKAVSSEVSKSMDLAEAAQPVASAEISGSIGITLTQTAAPEPPEQLSV